MLKSAVYGLYFFVGKLFQEKPAHKIYLARVNIALVTNAELNRGTHLPECINQSVQRGF